MLFNSFSLACLQVQEYFAKFIKLFNQNSFFDWSRGGERSGMLAVRVLEGSDASGLFVLRLQALTWKNLNKHKVSGHLGPSKGFLQEKRKEVKHSIA